MLRRAAGEARDAPLRGRASRRQSARLRRADPFIASICRSSIASRSCSLRRDIVVFACCWRSPATICRFACVCSGRRPMYASLILRRRSSTSLRRSRLCVSWAARNADVSSARVSRSAACSSTNVAARRLVMRWVCSGVRPVYVTRNASGPVRLFDVSDFGTDTVARARMDAIADSIPLSDASPSSRTTRSITLRLRSSWEMARARSARSTGDDFTSSVVMFGDVTARVVDDRYSRGRICTRTTPTRSPSAIGMAINQRRRLTTARYSNSKLRSSISGSSCV